MGSAFGCKCERKGAYVVLVGNLRGRDQLEHLVMDDRKIFKCISKKWDRGHGLD